MRVILLTHGGAELVLERLAALDNVEVVGVFVETVTTPRRGTFEKIRRSLKYDGLFGTVGKLFPKKGDLSVGDGDRSIETARNLGFPVFETENFHSQTSIDLMRAAKPDLGVIFGTNIIKENVFSIPKLGSINIHQGLAPYYRGGPPIFWEIFNAENEVGITVHFVAAKVDTGDIILQKTVPLEYGFAFGAKFEAFIANFLSGLREESANLVAESVKLIAGGSVPRKPQDTSLGKRYRLPVKKEKDEMRRRLRQRIKRGENAKG